MNSLNWDARAITGGKTVITTIDAHTAGEPLRVITAGLPEIPGATILERRRWVRENLDNLRTALMHEPRGHFDMYGAILTPPVSHAADLGVLFLHNEGYSTMCGHGIIALVTLLLETGAMPTSGDRTPVAFDTPAGLVRAVGHRSANGRIKRVSFLNVPSFVYRQDLELAVPGIGPLTMDIGYGGAFYAILSVAQLSLRLGVTPLEQLVAQADAIKTAVNAALKIVHPAETDLSFLYGVILTDEPEDTSHHSRNLCVFANREVDRSPTGTGVAARVAVHHAKGELAPGETIAVESILGRDSFFTGRVAETTRFGEFDAVVPEISGSAHITGRHEFIIDPADPCANGFLPHVLHEQS